MIARERGAAPGSYLILVSSVLAVVLTYTRGGWWCESGAAWRDWLRRPAPGFSARLSVGAISEGAPWTGLSGASRSFVARTPRARGECEFSGGAPSLPCECRWRTGGAAIRRHFLCSRGAAPATAARDAGSAPSRPTVRAAAAGGALCRHSGSLGGPEPCGEARRDGHAPAWWREGTAVAAPAGCVAYTAPRFCLRPAPLSRGRQCYVF